MIKEKPILFSGPMIRAILDGRKTQTRRVMKPQVESWGEGWQWNGHAPNSPYGAYASTYKNPLSLNIFVGSSNPYGKKGDGLWVREKWKVSAQAVNRKNIIVKYAADSKEKKVAWPESWPDKRSKKEKRPVKWRPSIFMSRWACRINLEITDIRVERVQDISDEDAIAEGVRLMRDGSGVFVGREGPEKNLVTPWPTAKEAFMDLWDSINGKPRKDGVDISWKANPWVWVVTFKKEKLC